MSLDLVVEDTGLGVRGAVVEDGRLIDLIDIEHDGHAVTDHIFKARVARVDAHLNAAFLDFGGDNTGFLAAKDARYAASVQERRPIAKLLHDGAIVVVQGIRDAEHGKGPRFTTDIKLFGMLLVYRPHSRMIEASVKLASHERAQLVERVTQLVSDDAGVLVRQNAAAASDELLEAEYDRLSLRWRTLQEAARKASKPGRLDADEQPLERLIRQTSGPRLHSIKLADPGLIAQARQLMDALPESHRPDIARLDLNGPAFGQTGIDHEIDQAFARDVALERGGRLIIEETAACVAIDVDGANRQALDVNLDAAKEIARLSRLRQLGGTIIVDFVDLPTKPQRQQLELALKKAFKGDPSPVQIYPMSPLGIVQISRARRGASWATRWYRSCPHCEGSGRVMSLRRCAEQLRLALRAQPRSTARVAPDLEHYVRTHSQTGVVTMQVKRDVSLAPGNYVLMSD